MASSIKVGWGTRIQFREPTSGNTQFGTVFEAAGAGSWFHIALPSTLTTFGRRNPRLESVTLLFETNRCRILHVHVYDGSEIVQEFNNFQLPQTFKLAGQFLHARDSQDINPESLSSSPQSFRNTLKLKKPHKVFSAIGISFYACAFREDFNVNGSAHDPRFHGPVPELVLTLAGACGQFSVEDSFPWVTKTLEVLKRIIGLDREP